MKRLKLNKEIVFIFAVSALISGVSSCSRLGEIREFQIWSGNNSLPPPYQKILIVRGFIKPSKIFIDVSDRQGEKETKNQFELTGDEYEKCLAMVKDTRLQTKPLSSGGSAFDVTLTDVNGRSEMGSPSNRQDWGQFAGEMQKRASD